MGLFFKKHQPMGGGFMDVIRCDEPNYLIWKWHPEGTVAGENRKENSIRLGSSLRVKDGSVAVFVYKQKDGTMQDYIEGPFDEKLKTANLPVLSRIVGLAYDGNSPFQAEVYFINLAQVIQIKFAVPFFDVFDTRFLDFGVPVAVRGALSFKITSYKDFIKLHRLDQFSLEDFTTQVRDAITRYVKNTVANASADYSIPVVQLERRIGDINNIIESSIKQRFYDDFGVTVSGVDVAEIELDKTSEGYHKLMGVTQGITEAEMKTAAEMRMKEMRDAQRISVEEREARMRATIAEDQYARHMGTRSDNLAAYQTEVSGQVGVAGAEGLGKMGAGASVNMGNGGGMGFNPAAMMTSAAIGGAIGKKIAKNIDRTMNQVEANNPNKDDKKS